MLPSSMPPVKSKRGRPPGPTKLSAAASRNIALACREGIGADTLMGYHLLLASGHASLLSRDEDDGSWFATCRCCGEERQGCPLPTQEEITKSVNWLTDRGYGLPVQAIVLDGIIRNHQSENTLDVGILEPSTMLAMRQLLLGRPPAPEPAPALPVIDAEIVEPTPTIQQDPPPPPSVDHDPDKPE